MSMFDGLSDALASVPQNELRFTFSEIECLIQSLIKFQNYLDDHEDDEQPLEYASDGRSYHAILDILWDKIFKYQFH